MRRELRIPPLGTLASLPEILTDEEAPGATLRGDESSITSTSTGTPKCLATSHEFLRQRGLIGCPDSGSSAAALEDSAKVLAGTTPVLPPIIPPGLPQPTTYHVQLDVSPSSCGNVTWQSLDGITPPISSGTTTSPWDVPRSRTIRSTAPENSTTCKFSHWDQDCIRKTRHTCDLVVTGTRQAMAHYTNPRDPVPIIGLTLSVTPSQCGDITWRLVRQAFGSTTAPSQVPGTNTVNVARGTVLAITAPANSSTCRFLSWGSGLCKNRAGIVRPASETI